jgi:predicted RNase H-like HicB family nuclease
MEYLVNLHIEKLPEGVYLATSDDIQGLVAEGQTLAETLAIAADVAKQLLQAQTERDALSPLKALKDSFDYSLIVNN